MGSRGPISKGRGRQRRNQPATVVELHRKASPPAVDPAMPAPPPRLLVVSRRAWAAFWASDLSNLVEPGDMPALERLFRLRDEQERATRAYIASRFVDGPGGRIVMSPAAALLMKLEKLIGPLEDKFGLSPMARARLGLTWGKATLTAAELNDMTLRSANESRPVDDDEAALLAEFDTDAGDDDEGPA